jgi:Ran GTPase-activating protein (RanGAP) involved in mRNA processing and transport
MPGATETNTPVTLFLESTHKRRFMAVASSLLNFFFLSITRRLDEANIQMPQKRTSHRSSRAVADDGSLSDFVDSNSDNQVDSEDSESYNVDEDTSVTNSAADSLDDDGTASSEDLDDGIIRDDDSNRLCYRLATDALTELDIDMSCIVGVAKEIAKLLTSNSSLKQLALLFTANHLEAEERYQRNILMILCSGIAVNSYIVDIQICNADLNGEMAFLLGSTLAQNHSVEKISLKNCNLIDSGLAVLFLGMQRNQQIRELAILSCDLSGFNSDVVAASLPLMNLTSLTLDNTNLTLEGVRFLCHRMKDSPDLLQLNLSGNALGRRGMKLIISCLKSPRQKLKYLDLSCCDLDDACVKYLAKCLQENPNLVHLNLSDNNIGNDGAEYLKLLLNENHCITDILVDGCRISKRRLRMIDDGLRYNSTFLKTIFSESISLAILDSVDLIENLASSP